MSRERLVRRIESEARAYATPTADGIACSSGVYGSKLVTSSVIGGGWMRHARTMFGQAS